MTRPTVLNMDLVVVPREADATMWTAAAVPLERWRKETFFGSKNDAAVLSYRAALSASPYPTAWGDVRKYVEGLERERPWNAAARTGSDWQGPIHKAVREALSAAHDALYKDKTRDVLGMSNGPFSGVNYTLGAVMEMESRIAELEKRLADAERVIEPFADGRAKVTHANGCRHHGGHDCDCGKDDYLRAARAYMEGK